MSRFRHIKKNVRNILIDEDWHHRLDELEKMSPQELIAPLLSLRLDRDERVRWRAAPAFGETVARMASISLEKARVVMRTCMWYMNEESGNLGWGIPHFMAEVMVRNEKIAKEFHKILSSYIFCDQECDGNYLDHPELRRDVFWGLARLAMVRPEYVIQSERFLVLALDDADAYNRGYAAWCLRILKTKEAAIELERVQNDLTVLRTFDNNGLVDVTVSELAMHGLHGAA